MMTPRDEGAQKGRMTIRFTLMDATCSCSALPPLTHDTALIAYCEFNVPSPDGAPCKSIRVRRVKAALD